MPNAIATLEGDGLAADGFRERLDEFSSQMSAADTDPGPPLDDKQAWQALESSLRAQLGRYTNVESVVARDTALALFAATVLVGHARDPVFARGYIRAIAEQVCPMEHFGSVLRAARAVVRGEAGAADAFESGLRAFWGEPECGPTDKPLPPWPDPEPGPFPPRPSPCPSWPPKRPFVRIPDAALEKWLCQAEMVNALRQILANQYTITSLRPARACPGQTLLITGSNFGTAGGLVRFRLIGGGSMDVTPSSWNDAEVRVTVPAEAVSGPLSLIHYNDTVAVCGRFIDVYKQSSSLTMFEGGATRVTSVVLGGTMTPECIDPREPLWVNWNTNNADSVELDIRTRDGVVLHSEAGYPPTGSYRQKLPHWTTTQTVTIRVTASGPCGTDSTRRSLIVQRPYALSIDGMEITQAIQYYRAVEHLDDADDRGADNSVRLVVGKNALLRVYLRSGQDPDFENGFLRNVTGTVTVQRWVSGVWQTVQALTPIAPAVAFHEFPSYSSERGSLPGSLNFAVPGAVMTGRLRFSVEVSSPDACAGNRAEADVEVTVDLQQTLNVRAVAIGYQGPDLNTPPNMVSLTPPTFTQITTDLGYALAAFPVQTTPTVAIIATVTATQPLDETGWDAILELVRTARKNDLNRLTAAYVGWVPTAIPFTDANGAANLAARPPRFLDSHPRSILPGLSSLTNSGIISGSHMHRAALWARSTLTIRTTSLTILETQTSTPLAAPPSGRAPARASTESMQTPVLSTARNTPRT